MGSVRVASRIARAYSSSSRETTASRADPHHGYSIGHSPYNRFDRRTDSTRGIGVATTANETVGPALERHNSLTVLSDALGDEPDHHGSVVRLRRAVQQRDGVVSVTLERVDGQ
ncbi:hypothetical protein D8S78_07060 [Natrialba swarupiae]|nr:hypothetical protein [Natrialba swarupiae]